LGWASGGRVRQFMSLVREAMGQCWDQKVDQITPAIVDSVIDEARRTLELGIDRGDLAILRQVMLDQKLPDDDNAIDLLNSFWLLPYPNESEWYFPHPLLVLSQLRP
jgi:hypothetical protein